MSNRFFLTLLMLSMPVTVLSAADPLAHDDPFTGFKFPRTIAGFTFQNHVQYPRVGLGYALNYVERGGTTATIVIYDLNATGIPDGTASAEVREQFKDIEPSIAAMAKQGGYRELRRLEIAQPLSKAWLQANHELVRADGRVLFSYSFIRAQNGKYVNVRVTAPSSVSYARLPLLLLGVTRAIGMMSGQGKPSE
jgi:hypothetical protein